MVIIFKCGASLTSDRAQKLWANDLRQAAADLVVQDQRQTSCKS